MHQNYHVLCSKYGYLGKNCWINHLQYYRPFTHKVNIFLSRLIFSLHKHCINFKKIPSYSWKFLHSKIYSSQLTSSLSKHYINFMKIPSYSRRNFHTCKRSVRFNVQDIQRIFQEYSKSYFINQLLLIGKILNGIFLCMQLFVMFSFHF